jgi:small subunit ribosomal protein S11
MVDEIKKEIDEVIDQTEDTKSPEELKQEKNDNPLGLEELPEEIKKKLEKKKAENEQQKGKRGAKRRKKKTIKRVPLGKAFIKATYNNTIVTLTDMQGNVISWASAGIAGFKGPKKSTPYAASIITRLAVGKAREDYGLQEVIVFVRGVGTGREAAVRALNSNGLIINSIKDITPIPHNGCRPKKPRRV